MTVYARETSVPVERSRAEIEHLLLRYGAERFASGWEPGQALIQFQVKGRMVHFLLPLPEKSEARFWEHKRYSWQKVTAAEAEKRWSQECRSRWRALALVIKAKLEAVESGITTFEAEFLAHFVMPNGMTIGAALTPRLLVGVPQLGAGEQLS